MNSGFNATTTVDQVLQGLDLSGRQYLITGGNSGLGLAAATALAAHGASLLLTARDEAKGNAARRAILERLPQASIRTCVLDLASLASVRAFTDQLRSEVDQLDGILANAGIMATDESRTADGFESQFGTNHLGHFLMVNRLAGLLRPGGRLVMVSSGAHRLHDVDLDDPNFERKPYDRWDAYGQSKSANALFALAFDARWKPRGVRAFTIAPGIIKETNLHHHLREEHFAVLRSRQEVGKLPRKTLDVGVATPVFALVHPALDGEGGRFIEDCGFAQVNPDTTQADGVIPWVLNLDHAERLWALSERLVGESFPPPAAVPSAARGSSVPSAAGGLATNRLPSTSALAGQVLELVLPDGGSCRLAFTNGLSCRWSGLPGLGLSAEGGARADVVEAAPGTLYIDLLLEGIERETVMLAVHRPTRRALFVATAMGERTEREAGRVRHAVTTRFRQRFTPAVLQGPGPVGGAEPAPTRELIGTRSLYVYGPETVYEHVYLNSGWYAYNSIQGVRRGDAGCDEATAYKLADGVLVLAWREVLIDIAAVFVYDMHGLRTTGKAWGTPTGEGPVRNIPAGAHIVKLADCEYPQGMEPA